LLLAPFAPSNPASPVVLAPWRGVSAAMTLTLMLMLLLPHDMCTELSEHWMLASSIAPMAAVTTTL